MKEILYLVTRHVVIETAHEYARYVELVGIYDSREVADLHLEDDDTYDIWVISKNKTYKTDAPNSALHETEIILDAYIDRTAQKRLCPSF